MMDIAIPNKTYSTYGLGTNLRRQMGIVRGRIELFIDACRITSYYGRMRNDEIVKRYLDGESPYMIAPDYHVTSRQVQRIINEAGVSRTGSEAFKLAIDMGRMKYYRKPEELKTKRKHLNLRLRFAALERDNHACVLCGATVKDGVRIEVDHIDENSRNNALENLQTLCGPCNRGKHYYKAREES